MLNTIKKTAEVRFASQEDETVIFHWRNLSWVIALGESGKSVSQEEHHKWFISTLAKDQRLLFVIEVEGMPAGMIRYDLLSERSAEVSIYLMPEFAGHGVGTHAFLRSIPLLLSWKTIDLLMARVLKSNSRSLNFFQNLNFVLEQPKSLSDVFILNHPLKEIQHSRPYSSHSEIEAVSEVIASSYWAHGPVASKLEKSWCELTSMSNAVCVGSGLGALRLSLFALGVGSQDEVIVPAYSCVALLNAVLALGANPVLVDVVEDQWTLSAQEVQRRLSKKTKAIIAVHLFGIPVNMSQLASFGLPIIEDCAHGIGGQCEEIPFGGSGWVSIASFYATKMIAGGGGGIVATRDPAVIERVRKACDYGDQIPHPQRLNDKITDIEAALAYTQLQRLHEILALRAERAKRYQEWLSPLVQKGLIVLPLDPPGRIWYRYAIRLNRHHANEVCRLMAQYRVRAEQPVWDLRDCEFWSPDFKNTSLAFDRVISLPLYPDLSIQEQQIVCHTLTQCLLTT